MNDTTLPDHLTYEPTPYAYPYQYELQWNPDAKRIYYTEAYWNHMQATAERRERLTDDIVESVNAVRAKSTPFSRGTKSGNCVICEKPFANGQPDQITCGGERCKAEQQKRRERKSIARRTAKRTTRTCPICEAPFTVTYRNKTVKTCGKPACTSEARSRAGKRAHELKGAAA